jgi:hypothetical protein
MQNTSMRNKTFCPLSDAIEEGAANGLRLRMTAPLTPSCFPDDPVPRQSVRIDQTLATDLGFLAREVSKNAFFETRIGDGSWSAINVLSAYTNAFHAMLLETGDCRYLPGPEWIPDGEGDEVMRIAASLLAEAEGQSGGGTVCLGYNWSPLGFGEPEGKSGLQSIPTKFHPQIWAWWPLPDFNGFTQYNDFRAEWVRC